MSRIALAAAVTCAACGSIAPDRPGTGDDPSIDSGRLTVSPEGNGASRVEVNAHDEGTWVYFDLETGTETAENDPWDLAFMRFQIRTAVEAARLDEAFDDVTRAPADGYRVDAKDSDDEGTDPDLAFLYPEPWYEYELSTHRLSPYDVTYVVKSTDGAYFKVSMVTYYDVAGSSGHPAFRFAPVASP